MVVGSSVPTSVGMTGGKLGGCRVEGDGVKVPPLRNDNPSAGVNVNWLL